MKLSSAQKKILSYCSTRADKELPEIAKITKLNTNTVRYALQSLFDKNIIEKQWVINIWLLGYSRYNIYFSLNFSNRSAREKLFKDLLKEQMCGFMAELGGAYDYEISILAPNEFVAMRFFHNLSRKHGLTFRNKLVVHRTEISLFPRKYLYSRKENTAAITYSMQNLKYELTDTEHRILYELSLDGSQSLRSISKKIDVPASTVEYSFKKLKARGIIAGAIFAVFNSSYGAFSYVLQVVAKGFDINLKQDLYKYTVAHPNCTHFIECFGSLDYSIGVETQSYQDLVSLREELSEKFSDSISHVEIVARLAIKKYVAYPFMDNPSI